MLYAFLFATAQSSAAITVLMTPRPCCVEHLQADEVRIRRDAGARAEAV